MMTRLKELIFAFMLSPAVYYYGYEGALFFGLGLSLYVTSHVARECALADGEKAGSGES